MQYVTMEGTQGICPDGWHIPTDDEWKTLEKALGMTQTEVNGTGYRGTNQGSQLAGNDVMWAGTTIGGNEAFGSSGFIALPAGFRETNGQWTNHTRTSYFYSSSLSNSKAWIRSLDWISPKINRDTPNISRGGSLRCVKD